MILTTLALLAFGQQPSSPPSPESVVRDFAPLLGSPSTRHRAMDRLGHAGPAVLPLLEARGVEPSVLRRLRETVDLHAALQDSYSGPRLFSFEAKEESLGALLNRLEVGSGMTFHKHAVDLAGAHAVPLKDATFWEALDALARKVPFTFQPYVGDQLYLNAGPASEKPVCYYGPFRIALDRIILQRRVDFDRTAEDLSARIHFLWEGHVSPLGLSKKFRIDRADDDTGASLLLPPVPKDGPPAARPPVSTRVAYEILDVGPLRPLSAAAKRIAALEGILEVEFPTSIDKAVFEKPASGETVSLQGVTVELKNLSPTPGQGLTAEFALRFDHEKEAAAFRANARDLTFVPSAGTSQPIQVMDSRIEKNLVSFTARIFRVAAPRDLKQVVLRVPRGIRIMEVPFRYRDVELR